MCSRVLIRAKFQACAAIWKGKHWKVWPRDHAFLVRCSEKEKLIAASGVSVLVVFFLTRCAATSHLDNQGQSLNLAFLDGSSPVCGRRLGESRLRCSQHYVPASACVNLVQSANGLSCAKADRLCRCSPVAHGAESACRVSSADATSSIVRPPRHNTGRILVLHIRVQSEHS